MDERFWYRDSIVDRAKSEAGGIIAARAREKFARADDENDKPAKRKALKQRLIGLLWQNPRKRNKETYPLFFHEITEIFWAVTEGNE
jgi:hypothetical protein